jgi:hypothetical protein
MTYANSCFSRAARVQRRRRPELISLLEAISSARRDLSLKAFDARSVAWAIQSGLGPLLYRAARQNADNPNSAYWFDVKSSDLTARIIMGTHLDAMEEILTACRGELPPLTLLKGISIAEEFYPEPHLRLMRDVDFLVQKESLPKVKAILDRLGYRQQSDPSAPPYDNHHHAAPFLHEAKDVWVEVHHGLFAPRRRASGAKIFQPETVLAQSLPSQFRGIEVRRLSPELQLVYVATHWAQDLPTIGGMVALVDAIYLLQQRLSWEWILNSVRSSIAASYLYLLLSYMDHHGLVEMPPGVVHELFLQQSSFGEPGLAVAHAIIDHYCVTGKPLGRLGNKILAMLWNALTSSAPAYRARVSLPFDQPLSRRWRVH